ncbi:MAG: hypothetical protein CM1200mP18_14490 [Gammaproteobacteria bacterium]|nr:MAG: hypothetical protein CM1200mP18_14490 [Gammaproteobacteria bacterium]
MAWPDRSNRPAVRKGLGDDVALLVDANSGFSPARAIEVGKMLEQYGVEHFEEPCPYWELEQTQTVTQALSLDVTGGEQDCEIPTWRRMIDMRAVDIVQPDVCYWGAWCAPWKLHAWRQRRDALYTALCESIYGNAVHHAPFAGYRECGKVSRVFD